ncbi:MAG: ABC transporter ATP-binding protein [Planctomycetota bacterium]
MQVNTQHSGEALLVAENLTKVFRRRPNCGGALRAVDNLSFTAYRGDVFGFLGPNGAGKSTTIRMILGLIYPTSGRVAIGGHTLAGDRLSALRQVGAFVEAPSFYPYLTGRKNLEIFSWLSGGAREAEIDWALEMTGLRGRELERVAVYSHGMKQRLGIAACLLPRPELLVLDEPTDGLDPHGIREIRELIVRLAGEEGLTIFLSSHMLGEVENLCNRIAILDRGRLILEGQLAELERRFRGVELATSQPAEAAALLRDRFGLAAQPGDRQSLRVSPSNSVDISAINAALVQAGISVRALAPETAWLERLFLEHTSSMESQNTKSETRRPEHET